jgi:DNA segregation ATPase FtsK/SpoIIIE-like protein
MAARWVRFGVKRSVIALAGGLEALNERFAERTQALVAQRGDAFDVRHTDTQIVTVERGAAPALMIMLAGDAAAYRDADTVIFYDLTVIDPAMIRRPRTGSAAFDALVTAYADLVAEWPEVSEAHPPDAEPDLATLYRLAVELVRATQRVSTSFIQIRLRIGYSRAASLVERMEEEGVIGPPDPAGKRAVLIA